MRLLRLSIYAIIVLAIAKVNDSNNPQAQDETSYTNTLSFWATPQLEQKSLHEVIYNDSVTYLNFYSNSPLNHMPMYIKSNRDSLSMYTRLYHINDLSDRKSDTNFSFIVF